MIATEENAKPEAPDPDFISFWEFFSDLYIPEQRPIPLKDAHRAICDTLEKAFLGELPPEIRFVLINMPPRIGKTSIAVAWGAWGEGEFPGSQWIYTGYSGDIAERSLTYVADVLRSKWYVDIYGDRLHGKKADLLTTIDGGQMFAEGVEGSLTSKGAGLKEPAGGAIVIDDAAKPDEVLSPVMAESVKFWFENTLLSRRNSDLHCPIVIISQRLGPDDLPGYIEKTYPESTLKLTIPALVDADGNEANVSADGPTDGLRSQFPETVSLETLLALRKTRTGRFVLAAQYQQRPVAFGGNLIQPDSFHRYDLAAPAKWEKLVITVDTAMKVKQANDFSALELWGLRNKRAHLVDLVHGKWESPELFATTVEFWNKWKQVEGQPRPRLLIEVKAAGIGLVQQLRKAGIPCVEIERAIDKVQRVQGVLPFVDSGLVYVPKDGQAPWLDKFLAECGAFAADGSAAHDDMVDAMVDGIEDLLGKATSILDVLVNAQAPGTTATPIRPLPSGPRPIPA